MDILENFDSISMSWISVKKGGNSFHTSFAHLDILKNFDSISMSKKAWHFLKSPQNVSSSPALAAFGRSGWLVVDVLGTLINVYYGN